jgi:hypothetical protein
MQSRLSKAKCCMYDHNNYNLRHIRDETVLKIGQRQSSLMLHCPESKQQHPAQDQCDCDSRPSKARDVIGHIANHCKRHLREGLGNNRGPLRLSHRGVGIAELSNPSAFPLVRQYQYATRVLMSEIFLSISRIVRSSSPAIICFLSFDSKKNVSQRSPSIVPLLGA